MREARLWIALFDRDAHKVAPLSHSKYKDHSASACLHEVERAEKEENSKKGSARRHPTKKGRMFSFPSSSGALRVYVPNEARRERKREKEKGEKEGGEGGRERERHRVSWKVEKERD